MEKLKGFLKFKDEITDKNDESTIKDFVTIITFIARLALSVELHFPEHRIPIINQNQSDIHFYSNEQIAVVIANGFFGCIPEQDSSLDMPSLINFTNWHMKDDEMYIEKLKFYYRYFKALREEEEVRKSKSP